MPFPLGGPLSYSKSQKTTAEALLPTLIKKKLLSLTPNIIHRPSSTGDLKLPLFQHNIKSSSKLEKQVVWTVEMPLLLGRQS